MREIKKILCAVDFSEATTTVGEYCRMFAEKMDAEVLALYVAPRMNRYAELYVEQRDLEKVVQSIASGAQEQMKVFVEKQLSGVKSTGVVRVGYAPETILQVVKEEKVDMVVMGTHGRRGINHVLFGSVAEKIVKSSTVPVLTIRPV